MLHISVCNLLIWDLYYKMSQLLCVCVEWVVGGGGGGGQGVGERGWGGGGGGCF